MVFLVFIVVIIYVVAVSQIVPNQKKTGKKNETEQTDSAVG